MKSFILALATSVALTGAPLAQQASPSAPDTDTDAATVPAQQAAPATTTDAPAVSDAPADANPTAPESEQDATTVRPRVLPGAATDAPASGISPTAPESEQEATTVPVQ